MNILIAIIAVIAIVPSPAELSSRCSSCCGWAWCSGAGCHRVSGALPRREEGRLTDLTLPLTAGGSFWSRPPWRVREMVARRPAHGAIFGSMGTLFYGDAGTPIGIEDRALAHLKVAIITKLRRGESSTVSWQHPDEQPRGRSTLWLHPNIPLRFVFDEPESSRAELHRIERLTAPRTHVRHPAHP